jgi:hypothetical protein
MQEVTVNQLKDVSGGGTRLGTAGSGDGNSHFVGTSNVAVLGGRIDPGSANN